jgi:hypothetical protein
MDREDGGGPEKERVVLVDGMQPVRDNGRVPIVAVDDIRRPAETPGHLQSRPAKEEEALAVVWIAVYAVSIEVIGAVDHVDRNVARQTSFVDGYL